MYRIQITRIASKVNNSDYIGKLINQNRKVTIPAVLEARMWALPTAAVRGAARHARRESAGACAGSAGTRRA